ncbi:MAG: glycosyltransferase [Candidatus Anstonellales archaeon]
MDFTESREFRIAAFSIISTCTVVSLLVAGFAVAKTVYDGAFEVASLAVVMFLLVVVVTVFNIIAGYYYLESYGYKAVAPRLRNFPPVAIAVPMYNEDPEMVKETLTLLKTIDYPKEKMSIHLLDDSTDEKIVNEMREFCKKNDIDYIHRENREWYKGGALNNFLWQCDAKYLAIFDADERLVDRSFLKETLGFMEEDSRVAFVQTEKKFAPGSIFGNTVDALYRFYFTGVMPVKAKDGSALFSGSCGVLSVEILRKLGGFPKSVTEDTAYSLEVEARGYRGVYVLKTYALGKPINTFTGVSRQQWRYTFGNALLVKKYFENWGKVRGWRNKIHYFALVFGLQYMSFIFVGLALMTLAIIFGDLRSVLDVVARMFLSEWTFFDIYLEWPAVVSILSTIGLILLSAKAYIGDLAYGVRAYFLNFSLSFVRIKATLQALKSKYAPFKVAREGTSGGKDIIGVLQTTILEAIFSMIFFVAGVLSVLKADFIGAFWLFWYSVIFSGAIYYLYRYR